MMFQWEVTIPELSGDTPRRAYVYVPYSYLKNPELRYPVLYMFDGQNVFYDEDATYGKSWGMRDYLDYTDTDLIVAAVECNDGPNGERLSEYAPFSFRERQFGSIQGRGQETMDWLVNVFKPYVDERYPTLPDREHTFIGGSSMGGLMSLYAVTVYNQVFSRAVALSPSIWFASRKLNELLKTVDIGQDTMVYMDYGSEEMEHRKNMMTQFKRVSGILLERGIALDCRIVPGGTHCEASWERQIPFFMKTLLYEK